MGVVRKSSWEGDDNNEAGQEDAPGVLLNWTTEPILSATHSVMQGGKKCPVNKEQRCQLKQVDMKSSCLLNLEG